MPSAFFSKELDYKNTTILIVKLAIKATLILTIINGWNMTLILDMQEIPRT